MANSAAPSRAQVYAQIMAFLAANGVVSFRMGWFEQGNEGAGTCQMPLAAIMPEPITPNPTHGGFDEEERIKIVVWFDGDGSGPYSDTLGGWFSTDSTKYTPFRFHDDITSGTNSLAEWFPTKAGLGFGSGQFIATLDAFEEYWWTPVDGGPLGVEMTLKLNISAGPATGQSAININQD